MRGEHWNHAEGSPDFRNALAERAFADDAEAGGRKVAYGMVEETELTGLLPIASEDVAAVGKDVSAQRQDQRERVLRDSVRRITADICDGDPMLLTVALVNAIGACRCHRDET